MKVNILKNLRIQRVSAVEEPAVTDSVWLIQKGATVEGKTTPGATDSPILQRVSDILNSAVEAINKAINRTESTEMDFKTITLEQLQKERPDLAEGAIAPVLEALKKENPALYEKLAKDFTKPSPASPNPAQVTPAKPGLADAQATPPATTIQAEVDKARTAIMSDVKEMVSKQVGDVLTTVAEMSKKLDTIGSLSEIAKSVKSQGEAIGKLAEARTQQKPGQDKDDQVKKGRTTFGGALTVTRARSREKAETEQK